MYRKLISLIIIIIIINCIAISFKISNLDTNKYINIEVKGEASNAGVFNVELGNTFNDLYKQLKLNKDADLSSLSMNEVLYNNEIITIPSKKSYELISINNASIDLLQTLPGIGKTTATKIIEYRRTYGSFMNLEELKNVDGIGDKKYEKLKEYICL